MLKKPGIKKEDEKWIEFSKKRNTVRKKVV